MLKKQWKKEIKKNLVAAPAAGQNIQLPRHWNQ